MAHLGIESRSLAQEGARNEPETVGDGKLVLDHVAVGVARVRVVPLVRRETRHDEQRETHQDVGGHHVQPNLDRERVHEREQARRLARRDLLDARKRIGVKSAFRSRSEIKSLINENENYGERVPSVRNRALRNVESHVIQ